MHPTFAVAVAAVLGLACSAQPQLTGPSTRNGPVVIRSCRAEPIPVIAAPPPDAAPPPSIDAGTAADAGAPAAAPDADTAPVAAAPVDAAVPIDAGPAPYTGDIDGFASNVVLPALEDRAATIAGCAGPTGQPVQRGFDVTMTVTGARIEEARVVGLLDPSLQTCVTGAVRGLTLLSAPPSGPLTVRCELVLRSR